MDTMWALFEACDPNELAQSVGALLKVTALYVRPLLPEEQS